MSKEERLERELEMSERYTEKYGKLANDLRLCQNIEFNDTTAETLWIDDVWKTTNVRYLTIKKYNDWIAT